MLKWVLILLVVGGFMYSTGAFGGGGAASGPTVPLAGCSDPSNPRVFMDIEVDGEALGTVEFELFPKVDLERERERERESEERLSVW
jgi:hypothetical protein